MKFGDPLFQRLIRCLVPFLDAGMSRGISSLPRPSTGSAATGGPKGFFPSSAWFSPWTPVHGFIQYAPRQVWPWTSTKIRFLQRIGSHCVSR